jgi:hypothetical protein
MDRWPLVLVAETDEMKETMNIDRWPLVLLMLMLVETDNVDQISAGFYADII